MQIWNIQASFTRPADGTQYAAGDLIANSTTAGSVVPMSFKLGGNNNPGMTRLTRARLFKSQASVTSASFRLHLYEVSPTPANGDNGAYTTDKAASYLGFLSLDLTTTPGNKFSDGSAGAGAATAGSEMCLRLQSGTTIYGLLEAIGTYTPASAEVFTVTIESLESY
jgi:hypothetical protein